MVDRAPASAPIRWPQSVMVLLVMAAVQRIVGFVRGVLVCRWLSPDELGQWDMAFGFLTLAAPLTVLGAARQFRPICGILSPARSIANVGAPHGDCLRRF